MNILQRSGQHERSLNSTHILNQSLASETELHKLLADEKLRAEQHRINYQTLKRQLEKATDDITKLKHVLEDKDSEIISIKQHYKSSIEKLEQELKERNNIIEKLDRDTVTPEKVESIKATVIGELRHSFKQRLEDLEKDVEKYRSCFNKIRHDYAFLKSEYDKQSEINELEVSQMKSKHRAEVEQLVAEKENWLSRHSKEKELEDSRLRSLVRDNAQLSQRLRTEKSLVEELQQRLQRFEEDQQLQFESQKKLLNDHTSRIKILELDKRSLTNQSESLSLELKAALEKNSELSSQVARLEKENIGLKAEIDDRIHQLSVKESEMKIEFSRVQNAESYMSADLSAKLEDKITELEIANSQCDKFKNLLSAKEKELAIKMEKLRESHNLQINELMSRKVDIESENSSLRLQLKELNDRMKEMKDTFKDQLRDLETSKQSLVYKISQSEAGKETMESLKSELRTRDMEVKSLKKNLEERSRDRESLELEIERLKIELSHSSISLSKESDKIRALESQIASIKQGEKIQYQQGLREWFLEKAKLTSTSERLHTENEILKKKLMRAAKIHMAKKTHLRARIEQYKERVDELSVRLQHLENIREKEKGVPLEVFNRLRCELKVLTRKHAQFHELINSKDVMIIPPQEIEYKTTDSKIYAEKSAWKDVEDVKSRMEELSRRQEELQRMILGGGSEKSNAIEPLFDHPQDFSVQDWNPEDDSINFLGWHTVDNKVLFDINLDNLNQGTSFDKDSHRESRQETRGTHRSNAEVVEPNEFGDSGPSAGERLAAEHFINTELESAKIIAYESKSEDSAQSVDSST